MTQTIYLTSKDIPTMFKSVYSDLECLTEWFQANKLSLNIGKTTKPYLKLALTK